MHLYHSMYQAEIALPCCTQDPKISANYLNGDIHVAAISTKLPLSESDASDSSGAYTITYLKHQFSLLAYLALSRAPCFFSRKWWFESQLWKDPQYPTVKKASGKYAQNG